jgi:hypothetical protein
LTNLVSDFDPRAYGFRKLSDLVRKPGMFEFEKPTAAARGFAPDQRAGEEESQIAPLAAPESPVFSRFPPKLLILHPSRKR